jgi:hypothetical protein
MDGLFDKLNEIDRARLKAVAAIKNKKPPRKPSTSDKPSRQNRKK